MTWKHGMPKDTTGESINQAGELDNPAQSKVNGFGDKEAGRPSEGKPAHQKMADKMAKSWGC